MAMKPSMQSQAWSSSSLTGAMDDVSARHSEMAMKPINEAEMQKEVAVSST